MKFIKQAFEMTTSIRLCLSYDLENAILSPSKSVYFKEICIFATNVVMRLLIPAESVM